MRMLVNYWMRWGGCKSRISVLLRSEGIVGVSVYYCWVFEGDSGIVAEPAEPRAWIVDVSSGEVGKDCPGN